MTETGKDLAQHMTDSMAARNNAETEAEVALQRMLGDLAAELMALQSQVRDLRSLTGNQGLAIHHLDAKLIHHVKLAQHTPLDVE